MRASYIIDRIRRFIDEVPLVGEDVRTDGTIFSSTSTNFSDEDLLDRVNNAQRAIVSAVKAQHVPLAISSYSGPFPVIDEEIIRLLYGRVFYSGASGNSTETAPYDPQGYFNGIPTDSDIVYQLIASRYMVISDIFVESDINPSSLEVLTIYKINLSSEVVGTITLNTNGVHVATINGSSIELASGDVLRIVSSTGHTVSGLTFGFLAEAEIFSTEELTGVRAIQRSVDRERRLSRRITNSVPTGSYPTYTYEDGELHVYPNSDTSIVYFVNSPVNLVYSQLYTTNDSLTIGRNLEMALIAHVASSCFQTLKETEKSNFIYSLYEDEIDGYSLNNRFNALFDDREVDIE